MSDDQATDGCDLTSVTLIERLKSQDAEAWRRLVALYGPDMYRWCRQSGMQGTDTADVVQEVFRAVASNIGSFRRERPGDSFRGWLWSIAKNKIRDHFRSLQARPAATGGTDAYQQLQQLPEESPDNESDASRANAESVLSKRAVEIVRAEFEPRTWEAFSQVAIDGRKPADVAEDLGMTVAAVYMAKSRVLRRLRAELADCVDE